MSTPTTSTLSTDPRFPLIVVDWALDRNQYDSGWLRMVGPADVSRLTLTPTSQTWDGAGRPVTIHGDTVTVTTTAVDPAVRNILQLWRTRVPVAVMPGVRSGDTAIPFMVDDVVVAREKLDESGETPRPNGWLRVLPILGVLIAAVLLIPLLRIDLLSASVAVILYALSAAGMTRWSYPALHWGDPPRRDPHDTVSRIAVGAKVVFWAVAAAAATLVLLDWAEVAPGLFPWV
ncbi:MAG: hypothetical protein U0R64_02000 [Candidatus Nanopelagicales bacterium]